jgi:hypothetical protein
MKKVVIALSFLTSIIMLSSCGGKGEKKAAAVTVSTEMQDFMNNLNGRSASVTAALETFAKPGLDKKDMDMYDLKEPKVLEATGNCYLLQCASGLTKRKYNICWEGGKISSVEDKGME